MVQRKILEQLGWSDDLIDEVTRSSAEIRKSAPEIRAVTSPWVIDETSYASNTFQLLPDMGTSNCLFHRVDDVHQGRNKATAKRKG